ncbi:hypothetical protein [Streptomyces longwoodensis]
MSEGDRHEAFTRTFLACAAEVARLLDLEAAADVPEDRRARHLAGAARRPLLERATLSEEFFDPLMAAAVYDPDPSFCRWFVEPALYAFGRRRVMTALLGTTAEIAGARRAWYWRICHYAPTGHRPTRPAEVAIRPWKKWTIWWAGGWSRTQQRDRNVSGRHDQA